jgi:hypothetical protein
MPLEKYQTAFAEFSKGTRTAVVARMIGCNYRTAWRLRQTAIQAMRHGHSPLEA